MIVVGIVVSMNLLSRMVVPVVFGAVAGGAIVVRRVVPVNLVGSVANVLLSWVIVIVVFSIFVL